MAFDEALAQRIRKALARKKSITEKKMFGGIVFFLNGNMLVGVWKHSLIVRLFEEEGQEALLEPHVKVFDITVRDCFSTEPMQRNPNIVPEQEGDGLAGTNAAEEKKEAELRRMKDVIAKITAENPADFLDRNAP